MYVRMCDQNYDIKPGQEVIRTFLLKILLHEWFTGHLHNYDWLCHLLNWPPL